LILFQLRKAVKGIIWPRFTILQHDPHLRHPVRALLLDQVAHDVERAPGIFSFVAVHADVGPTCATAQVAGVRARTAMASGRLNSVKSAMPA
jgi:hypothetical protein